jgi:hypothetical protein
MHSVLEPWRCLGCRAEDDRRRLDPRATSARRASKAAEANPFVVPYSLRQRYRSCNGDVNAVWPIIHVM